MPASIEREPRQRGLFWRSAVGASLGTGIPVCALILIMSRGDEKYASVWHGRWWLWIPPLVLVVSLAWGLAMGAVTLAVDQALRRRQEKRKAKGCSSS